MENDFKYEQEKPAELKRLDTMTAEEIVAVIRRAGIVGMGGAGFPTHAKLSPPKDKKVTHVIVNAAETGAVNDCHSGPFRYYSSDDDGIIFADCVYTPLFLGCACCGNIWHWDARYVESKNLYHMYKPLKALTDSINFDEENFTAADCSDNKAYVLALQGKKHDLYYIRNKSASWQNILRDLNAPTVIEEIALDICGTAEIIHIWNDNAETDGNKIKNIEKGLFVRVTKEMQQ